MPELPEVETIVRALRDGGRGSQSIVQKRIGLPEVLWSKTLAKPAIEPFVTAITDQTVVDVKRRGKFIIIQLDAGNLLVHLRMSGDLRVDHPPLALVLPHDRFLLNFQDGSRLAFNDARKFGRVWFTLDPDEIIGSLGYEPLDEALTSQVLYSNLQRKKKYIKSLLLDQSFIAGLGNIYTDESLHRAGIHPLRISNSLTYEEAERLLSAIRHTLDEGILHNGSSIDWVYRGGDYQNSFRVYQQTGKPCPVCGTRIQRIVSGQRGTHYCPNCQPEEVGS
jgi:formamidopyrimidine-DNA glycosylase